MRNLRMVSVLALLSAAALSGSAVAGIGQDTFVHPDRGGTQPISICCFPDGNGKAFTEALIYLGGATDATLTIRLQYGEEFIADFPAEDMWLESREGLLISCNAGTIADADTDADGYTQWADPLEVGGRCHAGSGDLLLILVNGDVAVDGVVADVSLNSPDINGDLTVNLADIGLFSSDYYSGIHDYRSDFYWDGEINLGDIGILAQALGAECP